MSTIVADDELYEEPFFKHWWLFLITGTAWLVLSLIMFRFDITSVKSIGILAGIVFLGAGVMEFLLVAVVRGGWWKALNAILGVLLVAGGVIALARPADAFIAIASVIGFMFLFVGIMDIFIAFSDRSGLWWLRLISGFLCIGLAFWASGEFAKSAWLLVVWVALFALFRGINHYFLAFSLRRLHKELQERL